MSTKKRPTFLQELTLDQIKKGLQQTFPSLIPDLSRLKLLNDGFSSYVVLVAGELILRIAKHAESRAGHRKEQAVLPVLQKYLPVQVPQPTWDAEPTDVFPFGILGYRMIPGIPFSLSLVPRANLHRIAQDVARFLVALHRVPLSEIMDLDFGANHEAETLWSEIMPTLHTYLTKGEYEKIQLWWEGYLNSLIRDSFKPRLIHGDPWGENIILNETLDRVAGLIDFETVRIGDIAQDFAAQKYLGRDLLSQVTERYQELGGQLENDFAVRLQNGSLLRELRGLRYAIRYPESGELMDALQKVKYELSLSD